MVKKTHSKNTSIFTQARCEKGWSLDEAADALAEFEGGKHSYLTYDRLKNIEYGRTAATPQDVVALARLYNKPELRNQYCCDLCKIGEIDAPKDLYEGNIHEMLVHMAVSVDNINEKKLHLMKILADQQVEAGEIREFKEILEELEKVSTVIESIQMWCEKMKMGQ